MTVRVSICIPTYNMGRYIGLAVESALKQSFADVEVLVCDNASTDETSKVLASFQDKRLKIVRHPENIGMISNFNKTIELSTAPLIKFLEADDLLEVDCVAHMVAMMDRYPRVGVVSVGRTLIDAEGSVLGKHSKSQTEVVDGKVLLARLRRMGNEVGTPTDVMVRRILLQEVGAFDPAYQTYLNDWDLWIRCAERTEFGFVGECLTRVRRHTGQVGWVGSRTNLEVDVTHLMLKKRWGDAPFLSSKWLQGLLLTLHFSEEHVWRGIRGLIWGGQVGVSRVDIFRRLAGHLGLLKSLMVVVYVVLHLPARLGARLMSRVLNR